MAIVFSNNARTTLASNISNSATTITVADGSVFPSLTGGDIFYCTIDDGTNNEIVEVTAISGNTLTVVRAQDNTSANAFVTGDLVELRLVAKVLETFPQVDAGEVTADEFIGDLRGAVIFKAEAGEAVSKGDAVYVSGISGNTPVVALADADFTSKMPAFGLVLTAASANGSTEVVTFGTISGVDTSAFSIGDTLYVSTTAGALTNSKPTGEASLLQNIGKVQRSHATAGAIKVGGAGRTNDTPNLNDGNIFIGNASNQATTASLNTKIEDYLDGGTSTPSFATISSGAITTSGEIQLNNNTGVLFYNQANSTTLGIKADTSDKLTFRAGGSWDRLTLDGSGNIVVAGTINSGAITITTTGSGDLSHFNIDGADANYDFRSNSTSGYTTTFNMDNTGLEIGHNSSGRNLALRTNSTDRIIIGGSGGVDFQSNNLTSVGTISSGNLNVTGNVAINSDDLVVSSSNSRVGINVGTPLATLDIDGDVYVRTGHTLFTDILRPYATTTITIGQGTNDIAKFTGSIKIGNSTIVDSSRNLTNIGTISSGDIEIGTSVSYTPVSALAINEAVNTPAIEIIPTTDENSSNTASIRLWGTRFGTANRYSEIKNITDGSTANNELVFDTNGSEALRLDSSQNATFSGTINSGAIDVTGTVTADGLTVDGNATLQGASSPTLRITDSDTPTTAFISSTNSSTRFGSETNTDVFLMSNNTLRVQIDGPTGDISFYEDTGTTAKLFWDASAESLGIGTTLPTNLLDIRGNVTQIDGSPEYHFATSSASHYNWRLAAQEVVDSGFEIASGTQIAGTSANSDTYTTRFTIKADTGNVGINSNSPVAKLDVADGAGPTVFDYSYATNSGIRIHGDEAAMDIVGTDANNHASSLLLRNGNEGFGFVNSSSNNTLELRSFNATADNFTVHSTGTNVSNLVNILTIEKTGNATFAGTIDASGDVTTTGHYIADTHFRSSDSNATLSATGGGGIYLRPDGNSNTANQAFIASGTGNATFSGTINSGAITSTGEIEATALDINGDGDISGNLTLGGYLAGPATFTIDPAAVGNNTGTVVIAGNLQVDGTTTTINSTTLTVDDKNITLASGSANAAAANGAGLTVDCGSDTDATFTYDGTNDEWDFNKDINVTGTISSGAINASSKVTISNANYDQHLEISRSGQGTLSLSPSANQLLLAGGGFSPATNNAHDLGRTDKYWQDLWLGTSLKMGGQDVLDSSRNLTNIGTISSGAITTNNSILISYSGNDGAGRDAGLKIQNDGSDWGAYIRKANAAQYGLRIDSAGDVALAIYGSEGGSDLNFSVNGSNGSVSSGAITSSGNITLAEYLYHNGDTGTNVQFTTGKAVINAVHTAVTAGATANEKFEIGASSSTTPVGFLFETINKNGAATSDKSLRMFMSETGYSATNSNYPYSYGLSLVYEGSGDAPLGFDSGFTSTLGNGQWGMYGHENSVDGVLIVHSDRAGSFYNIKISGVNALAINSSRNATFAGTISSGAITSSGNLHAGDNTDISMDSSANGQIEIDGNGYQGAIALDGSAMHLYHNSSSRDLVLGTNETARLTIGGTGGFDFESNPVQGITTLSSGAITSTGDVKIGNTVLNPASGFASQKGFGFAASTGKLEIATTSDADTLVLGRNNINNGSVLTIRKESNVIGSLGTEGGDSLYIQGGGASGAGLLCHGSAGKVLPVRNTASIDATIDLGQSSRRFKDLYLSGYASVNALASPDGTQIVFPNNSGYVGISTNNPQRKVHIEANNVGIPTAYGGVVYEATDAQIDIISDASGTWGSAINLVEGASSSVNTNVWSIARKTTGGSGDSSLNFNFGPGNQHDNTARVTFSSGGNITLTGTVDGVDIAARDAVLTSTTTTANAALPKAGGTMSGHIYLNNFNIYDINTLSFNDPGPNEGISWDGGNIAIYESPDDLTTNSAGNLQFVYGGTRRLTVNSTGIDVNGTLTSTAVGSGWTDHVNLVSSDGTNKWNVLVDNGAGDVLRFGYNSTKRVDISTGGNVDTTGFFEADQGFRQAIPGNDGLRVYGENANQPLIRVSANAIGNNSADYGFTLAYRGDRSNNENSLAIYSDNQTGSQVEAINIKQDGTTHFGADVYLNSKKMFFGTANYGVGAGGHNLNSVYADTLESGSSTDPLELVYYQGRGVNIGSGASKNLGCAGLGVGVADNGIRSGYMAHFKSTGDVALLLEADSDNVTETDNPFIRFEQDASAVAARIGYKSGTNEFEIFNEYASELYLGTNNANKAVLDTSGNWTVTGNVTAYGSVSDIRRKENVEIIPDALDKLKTLDGITFNFKDRPKERMTGVIAQQVEKILPEAVYEHETIEGEETLAVHYGNMVGLLIEAIKEQQKDIEYMKSEIKTLKENNNGN